MMNSLNSCVASLTARHQHPRALERAVRGRRQLLRREGAKVVALVERPLAYATAGGRLLDGSRPRCGLSLTRPLSDSADDGHSVDGVLDAEGVVVDVRVLLIKY